MQFIISGAYNRCMMEGTTAVMIVECITVTPVPIVCPAGVAIPPSGVISPIPRTVPSIPTIAPEPVVYHRPINIHGFNHVVRTIDVLIADNLYFDLIFGIFLHVDGCYILEYILREDRLQNDKTLVSFAGLDYAQVIHLTIAIEVEITERAIRVVEHRLELLQVLSLCEQFSYNLQIESLGDVRTLSGDSNRLVRPQRHAHEHQRHQKCS
jgi:hypothetical protein